MRSAVDHCSCSAQYGVPCYTDEKKNVPFSPSPVWVELPGEVSDMHTKSKLSPSKIKSRQFRSAFRVEIASGRITAPLRNSLWKSLQWSRLPIRDGRARPIHDHSQKRVITVDAQHVHDTLLAETRQCTIVSGVRNALVRMQLSAEVIDDLFVLGHSCRSTPLGDGPHHLGLDSHFDRDRLMDVPLNLLGPLARATTSMTSSLSLLPMALLKRKYSPMRCALSISSGLRISGTNGPYSAPRGPLMISSAYFFWRSFIFSRGMAGMRS